MEKRLDKDTLKIIKKEESQRGKEEDQEKEVKNLKNVI